MVSNLGMTKKIAYVKIFGGKKEKKKKKKKCPAEIIYSS